jgi:hypothetical protein
VAAGDAQGERRALADLFLELGPDAPTLCEGWRTADLAAHLVVRERRPDAALGIVLGPLAGHTERVQRAVRDGRPWPDLVALFRDGPPWPFRLGPVDAGLVLESPGFGRVEARPGAPQVAATGGPGELLLLLFGRQEVARVALDGEPAAVEQVRTARFGV